MASSVPDLASPRLALSQLKRLRRIVDAAIALAEAGGFDAVKLRDVADASGVALGTLYKYFRSKEDVLLFAVNEDSEQLRSVRRRVRARATGSRSCSRARRAASRAARTSHAPCCARSRRATPAARRSRPRSICA
jgi:AcrR family transcriptional regulator